MIEHMDQYRVQVMCQALQVSRSGFYNWHKHGKQLTVVDEVVGKVLKAHKGRAGAPCLTPDVNALGFAVSELNRPGEIQFANLLNALAISGHHFTNDVVFEFSAVGWHNKFTPTAPKD